MTRLEQIKQRLARYRSEETSTDQKLEEGSITEWVEHSDADMDWLVKRLEATERDAARLRAIVEAARYARNELPEDLSHVSSFVIKLKYQDGSAFPYHSNHFPALLAALKDDEDGAKGVERY